MYIGCVYNLYERVYRQTHAPTPSKLNLAHNANTWNMGITNLT